MQLIRRSSAVAAASLCAALFARSARAQDDGSAAKLPTQDPYGYANPQWQVAPSAGSEFGLGTIIPSLHTAAYQLQGRLGVSVRTPGNFALVIAGESGATLAFNAGNQSPYYGYLVRIPLEAVIEGIWSHMVSYEHSRWINIHAGVTTGGDLMLAAQCQQGNCNYIQPNIAFGLGVRAGFSFSAVRRSSLGVFITWHNDFAGCSEGAAGSCSTWLSTLVLSLGWTLF
jgi:hypothetical protein